MRTNFLACKCQYSQYRKALFLNRNRLIESFKIVTNDFDIF